LNLVSQAEIFPTQERDWNVPVLPQIIVDGSQVDFVAPMKTGVGEKLDDLQFADLVGNRLARR
jgi:hypothetical protein